MASLTRGSRWRALSIAWTAVLLGSIFTPVDAEFLGIGKPAPPPAHRAHGWDWSGTSHVTTYPAFGGVSSSVACRWTGFSAPYRWRFGVRNETSRTLSLDWGPFEFQKGENPFISGKQIRHVTLKPKQSAYRELHEPLGCPNMRGGQNEKHYYYVVGDHIRYAGDARYARSGFFTWWDALAQKIQDDRVQMRHRSGSSAQAELDGVMY